MFRYLLLVGALAALVGCAGTQLNAAPASLGGTTQTPTGAHSTFSSGFTPVAGVEILLSGPNGTEKTQSDTAGHFQFLVESTGDYTLTVQATKSYYGLSKKVYVGGSVNVDLNLTATQPAP